MSSARTAPRAAPPAPSSTTVLPSSVPMRFAHGFRQAQRIGVAAFDAAVWWKIRRLAAPAAFAGRIAAMRQGKGRFLVRHRDIDAPKAGPLQRR